MAERIRFCYRYWTSKDINLFVSTFAKAPNTFCFNWTSLNRFAFNEMANLERLRSTFYFSDSNALTAAVTERIYDAILSLPLVSTLLCMARRQRDMSLTL